SPEASCVAGPYAQGRVNFETEELVVNRQSWLDEVQKNLSDLVARSPAADLQRNMKVMLTDTFSRLDLVTREEFDVQVELLARTRAKLDVLEAQLNRLEGGGGRGPKPPA